MTEAVTGTQITDAAKEVVEVARKKATIEAQKDKKQKGGFGPNLGPGLSQELTEKELAAIEEGVDWILERYESYLTPAPDDFDLLIEKVNIVAGAFGKSKDEFAETDLGMITIAQDYVGEWEGALADNFNENFLSKMPGIMENQGLVAKLLHDQAVKTKSVYVTRRENVLEIAEETVTAIEAINDSKGTELGILLAAIIAAGTFMTLGTGTFALVGAAAIAGSTLGGPFAPGEKEKVPLGADTVEGVINNMRDALDKLDKNVGDEENTLIEAMERTDLTVYPEVYGQEENRKATHLLPIKPNLVGASQTDIKSGLIQFEK